MAKTLTSGAMHVGVAFGVTYAMTGSTAVSLGVTLVEATINTAGHHVLDHVWERVGRARSRGTAGTPAAATA
ncbi:MAG: DUF2061 domain-containing protein [Burkholderiales bacterium]|nr:DUF2061 domain-containing protein [Burkholderiales bacterium]